MGLLTQPGIYPLLINTRAYIPGVLDTRAGIIQVNSNALGGLTHSLKRLNSSLPLSLTPYAILVGVGPNLWSGQIGPTPSTFNQIDAGYSGNPLALVAYRPPQSPESWLYISDSNQMRKVRTDSTIYPQGIAPPLVAPSVDFAQPLYTTIDSFNEAATTGWTADGTYATGLTANAGGRITDTLSTPFAQSPPNWVALREASGNPLLSGYGRGMMLLINAGEGDEETVLISAIFPASLNTSIEAIQYDAGTTGPCCIVPASPSTLVNNLVLRGTLSKLSRDWSLPFTAGANLQVQPNSILALGATPEYVLVQSSTPGPLGTFSVRAITTAAHAPTEALTAVSSLRAYCLQNHSAFNVTAGYFEASVNGIGTIDNAALAVDLSVIGNRPTQPSDEIHLSVRLDIPANLIEGRIYFDVDSSEHDFTQNYYYASFQPSQLTPAVASTSTTQAAINDSIANAQTDAYNASNPAGYYQQVLGAQGDSVPVVLPSASPQAGTGDSQWTELFIPLSSLIRVGTDSSRTLANVQGVRIYFNTSAATVCDFHGLYVKGSYGPDVGTVGNDYYYRYRRRSTLTGAMSNPSPYTRSGFRPHGYRMAITLPGDSTEGDQLDIFRWGGSIVEADQAGNVPWLFVGWVTNPGPGNTAVFNDDFADSDIANAEVLEFDNQQPYSTIDTPKLGTVTVCGTSVIWQSGAQFNTQWGPGSIIEINGVPYTLYAQPQTPAFLEIVESATTSGGGEIVTQVARPTSYTQSPPSSWINPSFAFDNNLSTYALSTAVPSNTNQIVYTIPVPSGISSFLTAALTIWDTIVCNGTPTKDFGKIEYSLDGGSGWTTVFEGGSQGSVGFPFQNNVPLTLGGATEVLVRLTVDSDIPPPDAFATMYVNEIYLTVSYEITDPLVPVPFILREPEILNQPMYAQWGPFLGYLQAVGDPYQPGVMHCTKPNNPDSGSDLLDVEITTPSEPLMNGCMFGNSGSFAWSNQRLFQILASSDLGLQYQPGGVVSGSVPFVAQEIQGCPGLFAPWFFCVADKMYYGTATGIVATGGGPATSITDPDLTMLFPHDGQPGQPVKIGSTTFFPPDMTLTANLRLYPERDHIKFCYVDTNGTHRTIVYSLVMKVWSTDDFKFLKLINPPLRAIYDPAISCCYAQEAESVNSNLVGGLDYVYQESGPLETDNIAGVQIRMAQMADGTVGYIHGRDGYVGVMADDIAELSVFADGTTFPVSLASTGGDYQKQYIPLPPFKGRALEWAVTCPTSMRLFLKDTWFNIKPWAAQKYAPFQPFRDVSRETSP